MKEKFNDMEMKFQKMAQPEHEEPDLELWANIEKKMDAQAFFKFTFNKFNAYYLGLIVFTFGLSCFNFANYIKEFSSEQKVEYGSDVPSAATTIDSGIVKETQELPVSYPAKSSIVREKESDTKQDEMTIVPTPINLIDSSSKIDQPIIVEKSEDLKEPVVTLPVHKVPASISKKDTVYVQDTIRKKKIR